MPDNEERPPDKRAVGGDDVTADRVTMHQGGTGPVEAREVVIRQGGSRSVTARNVTIRQGGAGRVEAQRLTVTQGGVVLASTGALDVTAGGVVGVIADAATLQQSWGQVVAARESVSLDQAAAGLVASRTVRARDSLIGLVLARELHGEGVRVLLGPRAALAFGAGLGLALALFAAARGRRRG